MPIEGFDYKAHAQDIVSQVKDLLEQPNSAVPNTVTKEDKQFIISIIQNFCVMCGEALFNDPNLKFTAVEAANIVQIVAEWTFHKSIDMITAKIPQQNRAPVLQVIALNVFNIAKLACIKKLPQDKLITLVEEKVKQVFAEEIEKLAKKGIINPQQLNAALNASNLENFVENVEENRLDNAQKNITKSDESAANAKKVLKYTALAIVLKNLPMEKVNEILGAFDKNTVQHVINYMKMSNLEDKIDHNLLIKSLEEIKNIIPVPEIANAQKLLTKYHKLVKNVKPSILSNIAIKEREAVKDFILDTSFPAIEVFSPLVIKSLVNIIEEKINDN